MITAGSVRCRICAERFLPVGKRFSADYRLGRHIVFEHGWTNKKYYEKFEQIYCQVCGDAIEFDVARARTRARKHCGKMSCRSRHHLGKRSYRWNGGTTARSNRGYNKVSIYTFSPEHQKLLLPMLNGGNGRVLLEHRAVMAVKLGRPLRTHETVHHLNGRRGDNRPNNLELRVGNHGAGATASAMLCPHCGKRYDEPTAK